MDDVKIEKEKKIVVNIREGNYVEEGSHNFKLSLRTFSLQHFYVIRLIRRILLNGTGKNDVS